MYKLVFFVYTSVLDAFYSDVIDSPEEKSSPIRVSRVLCKNQWSSFRKDKRR